MTARTCLNPGCGRSITHMRSDARYCSPTCRRVVTRVGGSEAAVLLGATAGFWKGYRRVRRRLQRAAAGFGEGTG